MREPGRSFVVALDLGGSLTKVTCDYDQGRPSAPDRLHTVLAGGSDALVRWLADQITRYATGRPGDTCVGFGIVVPGIIESATGTVKAAPNVGWYDVPLREQLTALTGLPGAVAHDVRSGGLAEWRRGAGQGVQNLLFLPLGTGIAGAMVVDGRILEAEGYAGEIGHLRVQAGGDLLCACGQVGCLETVASAPGLARSYARLRSADAGKAAPLSIDAPEIADLARTGDIAARTAYAIVADALAEALLGYLTLLGPELVVFGGGLSGAADLFVPQVERGLRAGVTFQRVPRIVTAVLGADAGVIGAGLVGWDHVRNREDRA